MKALKKFYDNFLEITSIISMGTLVILTLTSVLSRNIFALPIPFSEEVGRFLFIWASFLGAAIVMKKNEHMKLDIFQGKLSPKAYSILQSAVFAIVAVFCFVLFAEGTKLLDVAFKQTAPVSRISLGVVYLVIPWSALFMGIYAVTHLVKTLKDMRGSHT